MFCEVVQVEGNNGCEERKCGVVASLSPTDRMQVSKAAKWGIVNIEICCALEFEQCNVSI